MPEYRLKKNTTGRFECGEFELTSGDTVELRTATNDWVRFRIEATNDGYVAVPPSGHTHLLQEGEFAREPRGRNE